MDREQARAEYRKILAVLSATIRRSTATSPALQWRELRNGLV
jgi:hypothetical protein